jgi:cytochrome P450
MEAAVEYEPFAVDVMTDPYPVYRELRAGARAYPLPQYDAYALPRFDDVWRVLADRDRFSIVEGPVFHRQLLLEHHDTGPDAAVPTPLPSFSMLDPPAHTRVRQALLSPFRPRAVAPLEPTVRRLARARLHALADQDQFDVRHDYASPVSAQVAALQLGFPVDDAESLVALVNRFVQREPGRSGISEAGWAARRELQEYLVALVAARRRVTGSSNRDVSPTGPDVIDTLLTFGGVHAPLDDAEIAEQLSTLFIGGSETLPKVVAGGAYQLWRHPDQRAAVVADAGLATPAFEEILRYELPLQFIGRTLRVDAEVAGEPMHAGQRVVLLLISANRDEREFVDPEQFDVHRRIERHLGLGHGTHVCIGAHVARLEGVVMMQELLARFPAYEVDEQGLAREASEFQVGWGRMPIGPA